MKWKHRTCTARGFTFGIYDYDCKYVGESEPRHVWEWYCHNEDRSKWGNSEVALMSLEDAKLDAEIWLERHLEIEVENQ